MSVDSGNIVYRSLLVYNIANIDSLVLGIREEWCRLVLISALVLIPSSSSHSKL